MVGSNRKMPGQLSLKRIAGKNGTQVDDDFSLPTCPHANLPGKPQEGPKQSRVVTRSNHCIECIWRQRLGSPLIIHNAGIGTFPNRLLCWPLAGVSAHVGVLVRCLSQPEPGRDNSAVNLSTAAIMACSTCPTVETLFYDLWQGVPPIHAEGSTYIAQAVHIPLPGSIRVHWERAQAPADPFLEHGLWHVVVI